MSTAVQLKEEGNTLFVAKKYKQALAKYSQAIEKDADNAILYANRAACNLSLKRYKDAHDDAKKSTELDPKYPKGWGRLATAQQATGDLTASIVTWQLAIETLPTENPTAAELKLKEQYTAGLKSARAALDYEGPIVLKQGTGKGKMPWDLANAMMPELFQAGPAGMTSSAWVIAAAHESWKEGIEAMKSLKQVRTPQGMMFTGHRGKAIEGLSNAVMRDERVFVLQGQEFIDSYNKMIQFEFMSVSAWQEADAERVIREVQQRQRTKGWDDVRPALSTTIRGWTMHAFMMSGLKGDCVGAERALGKAVEVLQWGRRVWKDVDPDTRGTVFSDTFVRGIKSMHIQEYMKAYMKNQGLKNKTHPLEGLLEAADDILRELGPPEQGPTVDPGFVSSFVIYPRARALSMKGLYFKQLARYGRAESPNDQIQFIQDNLRKAGEFYLQTADTYPDDDEQHVWFLNAALSCLFKAGAILRETLPLLERMRLATPKMKRIWETSALQQGGRDKMLKKMMWFEEDIRKAMSEGQFTEDAPMMPDEAWLD